MTTSQGKVETDAERDSEGKAILRPSTGIEECVRSRAVPLLLGAALIVSGSPTKTNKVDGGPNVPKTRS